MKLIEDFDALFHQPTTHPMVSVGDLSHADLSLFDPRDFGMYCVVLMDDDFGELIKGGQSVRYRPGTLFSLRPGQEVAMRLDYTVRPKGWMLAFRPELLVKTGLGRDFYMFSFFQNDEMEAVELNDVERGVILNCFATIYAELHTPSDYLSDQLVRLGIGQLLSYFKRFFERQFQDAKRMDHSLLQRLELLIDNYLSSGQPAQHGQPTVAWCAEQFNLSPNYFGDVVKRELHMTAQEYLQDKITQVAKRLLVTTQMTVLEIAEELGFQYPNHFTRMFTRRVGLSPLKFRSQSFE